jgi:dTDP-4-dehydrorhamnose 3,5-epimerase
LIRPRRFEDSRGWFSETFVEGREAAIGIRFVQDNHSYSAAAGTIRGIHLQAPPHAQAKLVRCIRGSIMDYAVDLRAGSPTYGRHVSARLSAANGDQLFIPAGFGHAFVTLEPDSEVLYKVSDFYAPAQERGVCWDCADIGIDWPLPPSGAVLSPKDEVLPKLADFDSPFRYTGDPLVPLDD